MKNIRLFYIFVLFLSITFLYNCSDNENPISDKNDRKFDVEIISCAEISIMWDSTIYQGNSSLEIYTDSSKADSLANILTDSQLAIEEMWTPNDLYICGAPIRKGSEIIVKLKNPDTLIYNYGFQKNDSEFPICCINSWRHYKLTDN